MVIWMLFAYKYVPVEAAHSHVAHVVVDEPPVSGSLVLGLDHAGGDHLLLQQNGIRQDKIR